MGKKPIKHLFGPPGYWARHAGKMIWVIGGDPWLAEVQLGFQRHR